MKNLFTTSCLVISLCLSSSLLGQETMAEKLLESQEESSEQSELYEILLNLKENPLDLNQATLEELEIIPGLTPTLRDNILRYRQQHGEFKRAEELLRVEGMDAETYDYLRELVFVKIPARACPPGALGRRAQKSIRFNLRSRLSDRVDRPVGFEEGDYLYSPQKIYHRIQYQIAEKISGGFLFEKDSGERRWDDLRLYYLAVDVHPNFSFLIGNYLLQIGQGLTLWGPYGFSKSADAIFPIKKRGREFRGYSAVDENAALHGGVAHLTLKNFAAAVFASRAKLDATLTSDGEVSGLLTTGFHRNENELSKKDALAESLAGAALRLQLPLQLTVGGSFYFSKFDKTVNDPDLVRQRFAFRGKENTVAGFHWDWRIPSANLFGEAAQSKNGGRALLAGALLDFKKIQLAFLFRDYGKDFQNRHGFGFADANGSTQNERGYYSGLQFKIGERTAVSAYYDIFTHPWRTFFEPLPFDGNEFLAQVEQRFPNRLRLTLRYRENQKQETKTFEDELMRERREFVGILKRQGRLQLDYELSRQLRLRSRWEVVSFKTDRFNSAIAEIDEQGFLMYQEARLRLSNALTLSARLTIFDSDSFNSAVFQYEPDLPGLATNRSLFGEGVRWYVLINYRFRFMECAAKYSETFRDDTDIIGSGADEIQGQRDRRFGLQIDLKI